jgi:hypothetical protein
MTRKGLSYLGLLACLALLGLGPRAGASPLTPAPGGDPSTAAVLSLARQGSGYWCQPAEPWVPYQHDFPEAAECLSTLAQSQGSFVAGAVAAEDVGPVAGFEGPAFEAPAGPPAPDGLSHFFGLQRVFLTAAPSPGTGGSSPERSTVPPTGLLPRSEPPGSPGAGRLAPDHTCVHAVTFISRIFRPPRPARLPC